MLLWRWPFFSVLSNDGAEFGGSIYQKVSDKLETAVNLAWTAGSNSTRFGISAKYQLDKDASVSVSSSRAFERWWDGNRFSWSAVCFSLLRLKLITIALLALVTPRRSDQVRLPVSVFSHSSLSQQPFSVANNCFLSRCETHPFRPGWRQEHQRRWPQAGPWPGTGSLNSSMERDLGKIRNLALNVEPTPTSEGIVSEEMGSKTTVDFEHLTKIMVYFNYIAFYFVVESTQDYLDGTLFINGHCSVKRHN